MHFELAQCSFSTIKYIIKFSLLFPFGSLLIKINSIRTELRNKFKSTHAERYAYTHSLMHAHSYILYMKRHLFRRRNHSTLCKNLKSPKTERSHNPLKDEAYVHRVHTATEEFLFLSRFVVVFKKHSQQQKQQVEYV